MKISGKSLRKYLGERLDKVLVREIPDFSRSKIQGMIKDESVKVNGGKAKIGYRIRRGDEIEVNVRDEGKKEELKSEKSNVEILHEDKYILVVNKPPGLIVHPSESGEKSGTLVNFLVNKIDKGVGESFRPGIVHRLDKDTSGVMVVARRKEALVDLVNQFKERKVRKVYLAMVNGKLDHKEGIIDSPISRSIKDRKKMGVANVKDGRRALSRYKVIKEISIDEKRVLSLLEVEIMTGRTHQIRVHMAAIDHPIIGDKAYGIGSLNRRLKEKYDLERQFLHSKELEIVHPNSGKKMKFTAKMPRGLKDVMKRMEV